MSREKAVNPRRRRFVPEVIQTSNMDCGPACLASVLAGFGLPVHLGRLREACQTDVDGTSIDTVEAVACELGLDAHQVLVPIEQLAESPERMLPAVVIVRLSNGANHFVVVWRRLGPWLQVMDPGTGRRWVRTRRFLDDLYEHAVLAQAPAWREWAGGEAFVAPLLRKLRDLGFGVSPAQELVDDARADSSWRGLARLDAAERATRSIIRAGGARRGREAREILTALLVEEAREGAAESALPESMWAVGLDAAPEPEAGEVLRLRGAVLVRFHGRLGSKEREAAPEGRLSASLKAALGESYPSPLRALLTAAREDGLLAPSMLAMASALAATLVLAQALTWRALVDLQQVLVLPEQRVGALAVVFALLVTTLAIDLPLLSGVLRMGRHLEARLRLAFQGKLPRLSDRYFQSRPISDMTERAHNIHFVRRLPALAGQLSRLGFQLLFTTAALIWISPNSAVLAISLALVSLLLPWVTQAWIVERELRARSLNGSLARFHLDALIGLVPIHTHGAERGLRREHEHILTRWYRASFGLRRGLVLLESVQLIVTTGLAAWLVVAHLSRGAQATSTLLLVYWALTLPTLGREFSSLWLSLPALRNATLRLLEPLGALELEEATAGEVSTGETVVPPSAKVATRLPTIESGLRAAGVQAAPLERECFPGPTVQARCASPEAVALSLRGVQVRAGGHTLLNEIDLIVEAGEHVAILGPSGAGKSTLLGLLLGWHEVAEGSLEVDGRELRGETLAELRRHTAWVDPGVQLWNRSMLENLSYGCDDLDASALGCVLEQADLLQVLEGLPGGLDEILGEGGGLLSGGEGQRTRLGRALLRRDVRLVLLDEPFRGIDRERRRELLARTREHFCGATLLCVTHDVAETRDFDRVIGIERGGLVADGTPQALEGLEDSPYRRWLEAEERVRMDIWDAPDWERWTLVDGQLQVTKAGR